MRFFTPGALWLLSFIAPLILMYILKQRFEEKEISSTFLWHRVLRDIEVNTPWQKLKKNILLLLQLLFIILLVLALADPFVKANAGSGADLIVVIDNTGSMSTMTEEGASRLELAKKLAEDEIKSLAPGAEITIISSGRHPRVEIAKSTDKVLAVSKLRGIAASGAAGNVEDAVSLAAALSKQYQSYRALFYTDRTLDIADLAGQVINLSGKVSNISLDYIAHSIKADGISVLVRVTNRSDESVTRELSLYADGQLKDITEVGLAAGETKTVYFNVEGTGHDSLWAELTEPDALSPDNIIFEVVRTQQAKKLLLVTERNIFIEKALAPIAGIELYKTNPGELPADDYDLYILDGSMPDKLPQGGSLLVINPPVGSGFLNTRGELQGGSIKALEHPLNKYMEKAQFEAASIKDIELPYWASPIMTLGASPAAFAGEHNGRRTAVIAFGLHESDFVLTAEFPIFMHNLIEYLVGTGVFERKLYSSGEPIDLALMPDARAAYIESPSGRRFELKLQYPMLPFEAAEEQGVYSLIQQVEDKWVRSIFVVNFPIEESGINQKTAGASEGTSGMEAVVSTRPAFGKSIKELLVLMVLMLLMIEWVVYIRGY